MSMTVKIIITQDDPTPNGQNIWGRLATKYLTDPEFHTETDKAAERGDKGAVTIQLVAQQCP